MTNLERHNQMMPAILQAFNTRFHFMVHHSFMDWSCEAADVHEAIAKLLEVLVLRGKGYTPEDTIEPLYGISLSGVPGTFVTVPIGPGYRQSTPKTQRAVRTVLKAKYPEKYHEFLEGDFDSYVEWFERSDSAQEPAPGE